MDDLLKELRNYLADARKREQAAEQRHKELVGGMKAITDAIGTGFTLISHTMLDISNQRH